MEDKDKEVEQKEEIKYYQSPHSLQTYYEVTDDEE